MANDLYDKLMLDLYNGKESGTNYKTLKASIWRTVKTDSDRYLEMFFSNWFNNNWSRAVLLAKRRKTKSRKLKKSLTPEQLKEQRRADANLRGIALMNMFLSDGETRLKDATGTQIRGECGWLQLIAKHVKPNEIVGKKLTAEQLFNLKIQSEPIERAA